MKKTNEKLAKCRKKKIILVVSILLIIIIIVVFQNKNIQTKENNINKVNESTVDKKIINSELEKVKEIIENDSMGYVQLVNRYNSAKEINIKNELVIPNVNLVAPRGNEKNFIRKEAAKNLEVMFKAAKKEENIDIFLNSGYRTAERQLEVYNAEVSGENKLGESYVALPGYSEHQTGLAVDLTCKVIKFKVEEKFENTNEGKWVINNAHKYGFILRYPKGKEEETGYSYEPWHYRYVGKEISMYMKKENLTLEGLYNKLKN